MREGLLERPDAVAAAAAVFERLPVAVESDWCDDLTDGSQPYP